MLINFQYGPGNQRQLKEACFVINVLDPKVKRELLGWFVKLQLSEYLVLFGENQDVSTHIFRDLCGLWPDALSVSRGCPWFGFFLVVDKFVGSHSSHKGKKKTCLTGFNVTLQPAVIRYLEQSSNWFWRG